VLAFAAAIVESSDDAIIGKTLDGMITSWNAGAERRYGYSAREVIGRWPIGITIPENELLQILKRVRRGERVDFLPDTRLTWALIDAPRRGVRVVVLLPGAIDNNIVRQASRSKLGELLKAGDSRSFALNEELNKVVYHTSVVVQLEEVFAEDLKYLRKIEWHQWRRRGFFNRLPEVLSLPVREQL
jgi:PAS domain S-box-containing protein